MFENTSDEQLLTELDACVRREKQTALQVLERIGEVDSRRLWLREGYSSLFDFCVRRLNYSEGEAARRIQSARCAQKVEEVKVLLEENTLSLTALSMIAPFVTKENARELLPKVENRSSREVERVLREVFPESKPEAEFLKVLLDEEMKCLLEEAKTIFSENDVSSAIRKALRKATAKAPQRRSEVKRHTRYVRSALRQEVKERDGHRCSFRAVSGVRCNQKAHLEIDHIRPWAKGGSSQQPQNLRVLCRAHNRMLGRAAFPGLVVRGATFPTSRAISKRGRFSRSSAMVAPRAVSG